VENLVMFGDAFAGKKVWLSGITGFKGSWLAEWLLHLGANVFGFALPPDTDPALFAQLRLAERTNLELNDLRDQQKTRISILASEPDFVFHLAAQPLVRRSYEAPIETYETNVLGTAYVLDSLRDLKKPCAAVIVTTDKCYENREVDYAYREEDSLGGFDPYSSSKAAAEIVTAAYQRSFFNNGPIKVASARAGNAIGGGDWASDRLIPDCIRALQKNQPIDVRNKNATRPWQHVLEPLSGYMWLAVTLTKSNEDQRTKLSSAFNFGPGPDSNRNVQAVVEEVLKHWPGEWIDKYNPQAAHEAGLLQLHTGRAREILGWTPVWNFSEAISQTVKWYRAAEERPENIAATTRGQLELYMQQARAKGVNWAKQ
jgi:CDP-glucose 4,6-dehydratase